MSNYILVGFVCFLIGFFLGLSNAASLVKKWVDSGIFNIGGKIYKIEEFKPEVNHE